MALAKVLITVKTYPTLSKKYDELVCTAGLKEDGDWIRIYPVPFRKLDYANMYHKWQWIEIDLTKNESDFRPESFRPSDIEQGIILGDKIDTKDNWAKRKEIVLRNVVDNMEKLIADAKNQLLNTSLAIMKPKEVLDFVCEKCDRDWDQKKLNDILASQAQRNLFDAENTKGIFKV